MFDSSKRETMGIKLEGKMWSIYSLMLIQGHPLCLDEGYEIKSILQGLERLGLVFKKPNGSYELVEGKKLDVLLPHLLEKEKKATLRRAFYLAFLIISLMIFFFYVEFLPQDPFTTISLSFSYVLFSVIAFMVEAVKGYGLMSFIRKLIEASAPISTQ